MSHVCKTIPKKCKKKHFKKKCCCIKSYKCEKCKIYYNCYLCYKEHCCDQNTYTPCIKKNIKQEECVNKLNVHYIQPLYHESSIGTKYRKFNKIYAKELCVDNINNIKGEHGATGANGLNGSNGLNGDKGEKGDTGDSMFSVDENDALIVDPLRDIPSSGQCVLFVNKSTNEIFYDSNADLIERIALLESKVAMLEAQVNS